MSVHVKFETIQFLNGQEVADHLKHRGIYLPAGTSYVSREAILEPPIELANGLNSLNPTMIGAFSYSWSHIARSVRSIGRYCSIATDVVFAELEHPTNWLSTSSFTYEPGWMWERFAAERGQQHNPADFPDVIKQAPITIGNDVWIGLGAYIRGGVTLGDGCIVGARTVVTKNVPPFAIVVGNPGRVVKYRFPESVIATLLALKWWRYAFTDFSGPHISDVYGSIARLQDLIERDAIQPYQPTCLRLVAPP